MKKKVPIRVLKVFYLKLTLDESLWEIPAAPDGERGVRQARPKYTRLSEDG